MPKPFKELTCLENVLVPYAHRIYRSYIDMLKKYEQTDAIEHCIQLLEYVRLGGQAHLLAKQLTLGMQRRLAVARALALDPLLLLLDETFSGLSYEEGTALSSLVKKLREDGKTIMLIEHNMEIAMSLSDRIIIPHEGKKFAEGSPNEVRLDPRVIAAYLGE